MTTKQALGKVAITPKGVYDGSATYERLDTVTYNGSSYMATQETTGNLPTNTTYWELLASKGDQGIQGIQGPKGDTGNPGASPLVASSTSGMSDTLRIYVNSTDGHWYWYDGDSWEDGGVYQATGIADGSIDILTLDSGLQKNFTVSFDDFGSLGTATTGAIKNNNGYLQTNSSSSYEHYIIDLTIGSIYNFTGFNIADVCGLLIVNPSDSNKILFDSNTVTSMDYTYFNHIIKINQSGLKAYMCKKTTIYNDFKLDQNPTYRLIDIVSNTLILNLTPKELKQYNGNIRYTENTNKISLNQTQNATAKMYALDKGKTYKFKTLSYGSITGLIITNENYELQYITPSSSTANIIDYTYTPTENCFAFLTKYLTYPAEITVLNNTIEDLKTEIINEITSKQLGFSKWYAIGDSITAKTYRANKNYLTYIKEDLPSITITNLGNSGTGYKNDSGTNNTFTNRINSISNYNLETDIITVMGSINDIIYVPDNLGQLGDTTTDTVYGSLYTFFNTLFTTFNGVRIGCISPIIAKKYYNNIENWEKYIKALKDTCELFNVPYLDLLHNTNLRPNNPTFLNTYYAADGEGSTGQIDNDGVHPNSLGYRLFYQNIKEFIKTL